MYILVNMFLKKYELMISIQYNTKIPLFLVTSLLKLDNCDQIARMGGPRLGPSVIVTGRAKD